MGIRLTLCLMGLVCACSARLGDPGSHDEPVDATTTHLDSSSNPDAPVMLGAWGTPTAIPGASSATNAEDDLTLSSTATELIYAVQPSGGNKDLYVMTRPTRNDAWGAPTAIANLNTTGTEESPRLSANDLDLYFGRDGDIYKTSRTAVGQPWGTPSVVSGSGNTASYEKWLAVCGTNHFMVSRDNGATGQDLFEGTLGSAGTLVAELSSANSEISTFLSPDCLTVYFASNRSGQTALYTSTRTSMALPWNAPSPVGTPFDQGTDNEDGWISTDQRIFAFASVRNGAANKDLYISTR
jgi:hypothetical protein